jgi:topoisomerase-4 subunit B
MANTSNYTEENIKSLDWREHIRLRPGMYIGKSGDGSSPDDGIYTNRENECKKETNKGPTKP